MIARLSYKIILELLNQFPVVGLIGPRQVGKTTLVKQVQKNYKRDSIYLDLELPSDLNKLREPEIYLSQKKGQLVILDEIQHKPELFPLIRSLVDQDRKPGRFIILGSASPSLLRQSTESLAGRIAYHEINPLHVLELPKKNNTNLWLRGGFPDSILAQSDPASFQWMTNFIKTYIERDLPILGLPGNPAHFYNLLMMIASSQGTQIKNSLLSKSLGMSAVSIKTQLDFFEQAFLITRLPSYHYNLKKRLVKSPKVYIRDTGMLHNLLGINNLDELAGHIQLGNSWETYVIQQIISILEYNVTPYFYKTQDGSEIDLVLVKGNKPRASIEIKYSNSPKLTKGNLIAFNDLKSKLNLVVTPSSGQYPYSKSIEVHGMYTIWKGLSEEGLIQQIK